MMQGHDDSARIADLEAQLHAIRDANEKLHRVADQYLLLNKESKDAEAQMEKVQCKMVDLERQLHAANEEVRNKLEASEKHSSQPSYRPDASCTEGRKFGPAGSGPGTYPRQQWPLSTTSAESAPSEMDVMSMSFEEQDDSARIADLEAQVHAIRDAKEKLHRVADQYLLLDKESKDAEAQMEKVQCKMVDLERQLQAANEEVRNKLEASENHSLAVCKTSQLKASAQVQQVQ
ncbi:hypothetical protein AAVH_14458 [Aphelenchoides avenae]|nr:hypothetical protein AAVH_14458 [Aphelenchus avenae]